MIGDPTGAPPGPTPAELLNAYALGAFPMDGPEYDKDPVPLFEADPRAVIPVGAARVPRSVARGIARTGYTVRVDTAVPDVLEACADRDDGTWLSPRLIRSYLDLHRAGFVHTVEAWDGPNLVGGLFGVAIGGLFTSDSMFHSAAEAGNTVLVATARRLAERGFVLWDIQVATEHTMRFGAELLSPDDYRARLAGALQLHRTFA